jgi:hypothetical protein
MRLHYAGFLPGRLTPVGPAARPAGLQCEPDRGELPQPVTCLHSRSQWTESVSEPARFSMFRVSDRSLSPLACAGFPPLWHGFCVVLLTRQSQVVDSKCQWRRGIDDWRANSGHHSRFVTEVTSETGRFWCNARRVKKLSPALQAVDPYGSPID